MLYLYATISKLINVCSLPQQLFEFSILDLDQKSDCSRLIMLFDCVPQIKMMVMAMVVVVMVITIIEDCCGFQFCSLDHVKIFDERKKEFGDDYFNLSLSLSISICLFAVNRDLFRGDGLSCFHSWNDRFSRIIPLHSYLIFSIAFR